MNKQCILNELGVLKNGLNYDKREVKNPCAIIGVADFSDNTIPEYKTLGCIDKSLVSPDFYLEDGDILFVRSNGNKALVGRTMYIDNPPDETCYSGFCIRFRPNKELVYPKYLFYKLRSPYCKKQYSYSLQTNITNLGQETLGHVCLNLPDLDSQKRIAKILECIDNKIECNKKINDNLYELLSLYCAHLSGVPIAERHVLSDYCSYASQKIDSSDLNQSDYVSTDNLLPEKQGITSAKSLPAVSTATRCHNADILVSNIRPYLKKIYYCHRDMGCSSDVLCIRTTEQKLAPFIYFCLRQDTFFDHMMAGSKGTKMPRGDKAQIMLYPIMMPPKALIDQFIACAEPAIQQIKHNEEDNKNLLLIRDYLLPILMSGQATIAD